MAAIQNVSQSQDNTPQKTAFTAFAESPKLPPGANKNSRWNAREDYLAWTLLKSKNSLSKQKQWWYQGVGDLDVGRSVRDKFCTGVTSYENIQVDDLTPLSPEQPNVLVGSFMSPIADQLPDEAKQAVFRLVLPENNETPKAVVVVASMTLDLGFSHRYKQLAKPLAKQGIATILPSFAFTGSRMPKDQHKGYHRTILDTWMFVADEVVECALLARWGRQRYPGVPIVIAGTSGGGLAAQIAGLMQDEPVGVVSLTALGDLSVSVRSWMFRYSTDTKKVTTNGKYDEDVLRFFGEASFVGCFERFVKNGLIDPEKPRDNVVLNILNMKNDTVCVPKAANAAFELLSTSSQHCKITWLNGGHVHAMKHQEFMSPYILETIAALEKLHNHSLSKI